MKIDHLKKKIYSYFSYKKWVKVIKNIKMSLLKTNATPHMLASGLSIGVFFSMTPFFGFHLLLSILVAWCLRSSVLMAILGTAVGNPFTFPFILIAATYIGYLLFKYTNIEPFLPNSISIGSWEISIPWEVIMGGVVLGFIVGLCFYIVVYYFIIRNKKKNVIMQKK